jgi:hypothetical protein
MIILRNYGLWYYIGNDNMMLWHICRNRTLLALCQALSPAFFRVGGTSADFLIFQMNQSLEVRMDSLEDFLDSFQSDEMPQKTYQNFTMSGNV